MFSSADPFKFYRALVALVLAGIVMRVIHLFLQAGTLPFLFHPILDAAVYHERAAALAGGAPWPQTPFYQAPGYPQFLGLLYKMVGAKPLYGIIGHSLLGVNSLILTALVGRRLFGAREGILAGFLMLGIGPLYFFEAKLLGTTVAVFLSILSVYLFLSSLGQPRFGTKAVGKPVLFLAGLSAGALSVVRANMLLFPLLIVVGLIATSRKTGGVGRAVVFGLGMILVLIPTTVHNLIQGAVAPVATTGGFNFYLGNHHGARGVYGDIHGTSGSIQNQEAEADSLVRADLGHELSAGAETRYWVRRGLAEIAADPLSWVKLLGTKALLVVNRQEEAINGGLGLEAAHIPMVRGFVPFNVLIVFGLFGLSLVNRHQRATGLPQGSLIPLWSLLLAVTISGLLFFVMTRLRLPAAPVLCVLAAHAWITWARFWKAGARRTVLVSLGGVIFFSIVTWNSPLAPARNPVWEANLLVEAGKTLEAAGKDKKAGKAYELAIETNPQAVEPLLAQGQRLVQNGDLPAALAYLERAAMNAPQDFSIRNNLGILYFGVGNLTGCLREMEAASALNPDSGSPYLYRAHVLRLRDDPGAVDLYRRALELDPGFRSAYTGLIELLVAAEKFDQARVWADRAANRGVALSPELLSRIP